MGDFFDKFSKVPLSQKVLLLLLVLVAIGVGFYMLVFSSLEEELSGLMNRQVELTERVAEVNGLMEQKVERQGVLSERTAEDSVTDLNLPSRPAVADFYRLLEDIAAEVQDERLGRLRIQSVVREPTQQAHGAHRIPINLRMVGTYPQAVEYMWRLATLDRIVHVRSVTLSRAPDAPTIRNPALHIDLRIEAYYQPRG